MPDYLTVEYSDEKRPFTDYPSKLASYIINTFNLVPGQSLLEIGCGRCELSSHFTNFGFDTYGIDNAESAENFAESANVKFELIEYKQQMTKPIFDGKKFDIIFTKSFVEHVEDPLAFFQWCHKLLTNGGKIITLTPDWESNYKIFYDDFTHVKPFTDISLSQILNASGYIDVKVFKFRQLPVTWNNNFMLLASKITSIFANHRHKNKWLRWSRELMIASIATKKKQ